MADKPHLKLNTKEQTDRPEVLRFNYAPIDEGKEVQEIPNYSLQANTFQTCLSNWKRAYANRINERNNSLSVPSHIEYISILFQGQFDNIRFFESWVKDFGLLGIKFSKFNHEILFAIIDRKLFGIFLNDIENFIQKESKLSNNVQYSGKVKFIKEFKLLSTADILQNEQNGKLLNVLLTNIPLNEQLVKQILSSLLEYLEENKIKYHLLEEANHLELYNISNQQILEIAQNFDIVLSVTSSLATVISPSDFNIPERSYGFQIENPYDDLPIIGIIDTGISNQTPLSPIIINDDAFNITVSHSLTDNANNGSGHGTGVAALAALGRNAYYKEYRGILKADARLLSVKILDNNSGYISEKGVLDLLRKAKNKYPELKIFVLTICYQTNKVNNEDFSTYSYALDKFAYENDCLIVISTANNDDAQNKNNHYDLNYFFSESTNLCSPAESMNNIIVGAAANSLKNSSFEGISTSKEFPTIFTRKSHIDFNSLSSNKKNKNYFRPDVIECGGDLEFYKGMIGKGNKASMEILSAKASESFYLECGTSFSAPLVANIAAQIQKKYPNITTQSIKALIINGSSLDLIRFDKKLESLINKISGHGFVNPQKSILSNDNAVTFLIEDEINPEQVKIFPLNFPRYLTNDNLGKKKGILKISATLCFSFLPVQNHQLAYCPIHIAFRFAKNQTGIEILESETKIKSKLKSTLSWSQDGRFKSKPLPYSNTQKMSFPINISDLMNENNTFKLAVSCRINPQLISGTEGKYAKAHPFSIAITIEETLKDENLTGKLYSEMESVNLVENIALMESEAEAIAEFEE